MGTRVEFFQGSVDGALSHFLSGPLPKFRDYCVYLCEFDDIYRSEESDIDPRCVSMVEKIIQHGASAFLPDNADDAYIIDRTTDAYYGFFSDECAGILQASSGGFGRVSLFNDRTLFLKNYGPDALKLWDYLLNGRAIGRPDGLYPYTFDNEVFRVGYWTHEEVEYLRSCFLERSKLSNWKRLFSDDLEGISICLASLEIASEKGIGLITMVA